MKVGRWIGVKGAGERGEEGRTTLIIGTEGAVEGKSNRREAGLFGVTGGHTLMEGIVVILYCSTFTPNVGDWK